MLENTEIINITEGKPLYQAAFIESLKAMLKRSNDLYGDKIAFNYRNEPHGKTQCKTYCEFFNDVNSLGSALLNLGISNSRIAIIGENRYEWVLSFLTAVNGAGTAVPLDKMMPQNEIEPMLDRGEVEVLFYSHSFQDAIEDISLRNTRLKAIICMNPESEKDTETPRFYSLPLLVARGNELLKSGFDAYLNAKIDQNAMRILLFTSGTSSTSKAVMLSHTNICTDIMALGGVVYFEPGDSVLSILPLHHTFENTAGLLFPLYLGMTVSISDGLKYLSKNLGEYKPVCIIGVPLVFDKFKQKMIDELNKKGMFKKVKLLMGAANGLSHTGIDIRRKLFKKLLEPLGGKLRVIVTGGAAMDTDTINWYESIGVKVYQGYGLTETAPVVAGNCDRVRKAGTCGQPLPGIKLAIANPDSNGSGEIVVQGSNVMLGYYKDEEATKEALRDGWFHTGDLGFIDKKGLIHVTGRVKSMIVLKNGKKVFPEELESHINKLKFVKESLVWGEIEPDGSVEICTKIILDKEQIASLVPSPDNESAIKKLLDSAIKEINKLMPVYKTIRYYVFSYEELIKTTSMKVKRYVETDQMKNLFNQLTTTIKNIAGRNIDKLKEMIQPGGDKYQGIKG